MKPNAAKSRSSRLIAVKAGPRGDTGVVCGVRVEPVEEPTRREIRYLDKVVDELAKGKAMARVLR
jgi:hypothetical protein